MRLDADKWILDFFDGKVKAKSVRISCDENNNILQGVAIDELNNKIVLSTRDASIVIGILASRENMSINLFLRLNSHPVVEFIRIKKCDIIKKMKLIINNRTIHKMMITNNDNEEREINDKNEQQRLVKQFALQYAIPVSELENINSNNLEIRKINGLITKVDAIVDEWGINYGPSLEKLIVFYDNGKTIEYSGMEDIRENLIKICRQECLNHDDLNRRIFCLEKAYRSDFLKCVLPISIINVIKPLYERIEIIERSLDYRMLPTKIRIVTSNHGNQVYDLVNGKLISDTNNAYIIKNNKNTRCENSDIYEIEKHISLSYKYQENERIELEKSFFVKYFAEQQLEEIGITSDKIGYESFFKELEKKRKTIAKDPNLVVSKVTYQNFEILESDNSNINKIRVITNDGSFIIYGYQECNYFIRKFASMKKIDILTLLKDHRYVKDLSNEIKQNNSNNSPIQSDDEIKTFKFQNFFLNNIMRVLDKLKLNKSYPQRNKQKKIQR